MIDPGKVIDRSRRRFQMQDWTVGEKAIHDAVQAVETMGTHPRLTKVVTMLGDAMYELGLWVQDDLPGATHPMREVTARALWAADGYAAEGERWRNRLPHADAALAAIRALGKDESSTGEGE